MLARAGDIVGIQIDSFRGAAFLTNADLQISLTGAGTLEKTTVNTGRAGGNVVDYIPPLSSEPGIAIITVTHVDGQRRIVSEQLVVSYEASDELSNAVTADGALAREKIDLLPEFTDPNDFSDAVAALLVEWFRGDLDRPEVLSVQTRLDLVQPGAVHGPSDQDFRTAADLAIANFQDWESQVALTAFTSTEDVLATDPLPGITPADELQAARDKIAPALRETIVRQDNIVQTSGFDFRTMREAAKNVLHVLWTAQILGLDDGPNGLGIDETLRNSLAFVTPDQEAAEAEIRLAFLTTEHPFLVDAEGNFVTPEGTPQFDPSFVAQIQPTLNTWFLDEGDNGSVLSFLEELQPGSPQAPSDYDQYSNLLKKAIRNWIEWRSNVGQFGLSVAEVLTEQFSEFERSENLVFGSAGRSNRAGSDA